VTDAAYDACRRHYAYHGSACGGSTLAAAAPAAALPVAAVPGARVFKVARKAALKLIRQA